MKNFLLFRDSKSQSPLSKILTKIQRLKSPKKRPKVKSPKPRHVSPNHPHKIHLRPHHNNRRKQTPTKNHRMGKIQKSLLSPKNHQCNQRLAMRRLPQSINSCLQRINPKTRASTKTRSSRQRYGGDSSVAGDEWEFKVRRISEKSPKGISEFGSDENGNYQ